MEFGPEDAQARTIARYFAKCAVEIRARER